MNLFWSVLSFVSSLYLTVFWGLSAWVWITAKVDCIPEDREVTMAALTRLLMALFWPVALFSGELWRVVVRNNFEPRKGEDS